MLEGLEGLPVVAQLRLRNIKRVSVVYSLRRGQARLYPAGNSTCFEIVLSAEGEDLWPLLIGHELAHTFFPFPGADGRLTAGGTLLPDREQEALCDSFAFCWASRGTNAQEVMELLAPLKSKRQDTSAREYQLEMPLWGF